MIIKVMRPLIFFLSAIFAFQNLQAQAPSGKIYGIILDEYSKQPLEFATIVLKNKQNQSTLGGLSDEKGRFNIENIKPGTYGLEISYLGYDNYSSEVKITPAELSVNLGEIRIKESAALLDVVEVVGEKNMFQLGGEKKIFNVDRNAISSGGNAMDAMKQIPTLDVSMDGNISLRGSENILIYINGKPSGMTADSKQAILESLPANSIESIELITNPSSKYDADGTAGIINIVLKKNYNRGLNGVASLGYATKYKNNAGLSLNFKKNRINFTSSYNFRFHESYADGINNRKNIFSDYTNYINSDENSENKRYNGNINLALDIDLTAKATLSFSNVLTAGGGPNNEIISTNFLDENEVYYYSFIRSRDGNRRNFNNTSNIFYTQKFKTAGQRLDISGTYETNTSLNLKHFMQSDFDEDYNHISLIPQQENLNTDNRNILSIFQTDYTHPFKKHGQLEAGLKITYRHLYNDFYADSLDRSINDMVLNAAVSNSFAYNEIISAAYISYGGNVKDFNYKLGVRSEQSNITVENNKIEGKFKNNYINVFPSVFMSQRLPKNHELQLSYTYRINRPQPNMLNPFEDFDNPLNIRVGNPYLQPELINALELTYLKNWNSTFLTTSFYFRHTKDVFTRLRTVDPETAIATLNWDNIDKGQNVGTEIIFRTPITKWWNIMVNGNLFYNAVKGQVPGEDNDNSVNSFQWNTRAMSNFKFWKNAELQLSYRYNSKMEFLQGYINPMHSLDIGIRKDFLKNNKASIAMNVQDLFNTRIFEVYNAGTTFESVANRKWETRIFSVNFTYKFGREENHQRKRNDGNMMDDGGGQMMNF